MPTPIVPDVKPLLGGLPVPAIAWTEEDWFAGLSTTPRVLNVGANNDSAVVNVGGYDAFMGILSTTGTTGTLTISVLAIHPITGAVIAVRQIATGVAVSASAVATFGAYTPNLPNDIYGRVQIRFVAAVTAVNLVGLVVYGSAR